MNQLLAELAPTGVLRAAVGLSNRLLVSGLDSSGEPQGVSPDLARAIGERLGVPVRFVLFERPFMIADSAGKDVWDIGLMGAEPERADRIAFAPAYAEIAATYLIREGASFDQVGDVDRAGVRIAAGAGTAYGLWLKRNICHAEMVWFDKPQEALDQFVAGRFNALANLRASLLPHTGNGFRLLEGHFTAVQQSIGVDRGKDAAEHFLAAFVEEAKASGLIADLIAHHGAAGLSVAP